MMADVAAVGCSDLGTYAAAWQGSRGKLERILRAADYTRLEPLFQQVVIATSKLAVWLAEAVCMTCHICCHRIMQVTRQS